MSSAGQALDFKFHQALHRKSHHLARPIGVDALLQQDAKVSSSHWSSLDPRVKISNQTLPTTHDDHC
jgi:hypothetical protein